MFSRMALVIAQSPQAVSWIVEVGFMGGRCLRAACATWKVEISKKQLRERWDCERGLIGVEV